MDSQKIATNTIIEENGWSLHGLTGQSLNSLGIEKTDSAVISRSSIGRTAATNSTMDGRVQTSERL